MKCNNRTNINIQYLMNDLIGMSIFFRPSKSQSSIITTAWTTSAPVFLKSCNAA